jgi:hypothetical protein
MDGYVLCTKDAAIAAFEGHSCVRHAAIFGDEALVAFEGDHVPAEGELLLNMEGSYFEVAKVRRKGPQIVARVRKGWKPGTVAKVRRKGALASDEPQTFVRLTSEQFLALSPVDVLMASPLTDDTILAMTTGGFVPDGATWSRKSEWFLDKRLALETA